MPDPIRDLEEFGSVSVSPLPPSEVRRLGDRRRTHRRGAVVAASVIAAVAVVVPVALAQTDGRADGTRNIATDGPAPTTSPAPTEITYPDGGVSVADPGQADRLAPADVDFRLFIGDLSRRLAEDQVDCPDAVHEVTVVRFSPRGYAVGAVSDCGGNQELWIRDPEGWRSAMSTQDVWDCDALAHLRVPQSFVGDCADEAGGFGPAEVSGLRLGMTAAEVTDKGAVLAAPGGGCRSLTYPGPAGDPDTSDGVLSDRGLEALWARPGMKTPERVGLGSSEAKVRAAYPDGGMSPQGYWTVGLDAGTEYQFGIDEDGTVSEMLMTRTGQPCFG